MKNKINVALVRLIQFIVFVMFTFTVIAYFGAMVLIPLDALVMIGKFLSLFGISTLIGTLIGLPIVGYLCKIAYETPLLMNTVVDTGVDLIKTGKTKVDAFNAIADSIK